MASGTHSLTQSLRWLLSAVLIAWSTAAHSAYEQLDGIVAVVDDDVVLVSELLSRLDTVRKQMAAAEVDLPPEDILVSQLMERLVLESIQLQQADRRGVEIDDETLTKAVRGFAEQNGMDLDQFRLALERDGLSYREFREEIRREMLISRLQRNMVNRRISITDQEIDAVLNSPFYQTLLSDEFRVGHILLTIAPDATDEAEAAAEQASQDIVRQLREGADFANMAITRSSAGSALDGGDLGFKRPAELPSMFAEKVLQMEPGEVAEPIRSGNSIHIIKLHERRGAGVQEEEQSLSRHILVRPSAIRSEAQTKALIDDLYSRVVGGEKFDELAKVHSEDPGSALNGGDLGWSTGEEFVEAFQQALRSTPVGSVSKPFRSNYGWHILEVQDRRVEDMSEEARRNMVVRLLHQRRFNEELEEWLKEIRDEAYVELRL